MGLAKQLVTNALSKRLLLPNSKRVIFVYHDISEPHEAHYSEDYSTPPENFVEHISYLSEHFDWVDLNEILAFEPKNKRRLASITFDDGFLSVKNFALPYLSSMQIPFALFVNKTAIESNRLQNLEDPDDWSGDESQKVYLDRDDVKVLAEAGVLIGSHSTGHRILRDCDLTTLTDEILVNKKFVEDIVNYDVEHFAIPYGKKEHYDKNMIDYCLSVGHRYIYSTNPVYFSKANLLGGSHLIPRIGIPNLSIGHLRFLLNRPLLKRIDI